MSNVSNVLETESGSVLTRLELSVPVTFGSALRSDVLPPLIAPRQLELEDQVRLSLGWISLFASKYHSWLLVMLQAPSPKPQFKLNMVRWTR